LRLPVRLIVTVASLLSLVSLSVQTDLNLQEADGAAMAVTRSDGPRRFEASRVPNETTARILALDEPRRFAFWTLVLKNRKQACDAVVRASYSGGTPSGLDYWTVRCRDGNQYSISVEPNAKDSVCVGDAFDRSALRRM
jgi:hypothetical protein